MERKQVLTMLIESLDQTIPEVRPSHGFFCFANVNLSDI